MEILIIVGIVVIVILLLISIFTNISSKKDNINSFSQNMKYMSDMILSNQNSSADAQDKRLAELSRQFGNMALENEQKLEFIRNTMEQRLSSLQEANSKKLEEMRSTVDEKLQKTLEERIGKSFSLVNERLEEVYKGLGEMQTLAVGVGDLKKVLSNVKTRGILGELQLGSILEQILSNEQYDENIKTKPSSNERVEFAIRLPGDGESIVYLPIDAKFPGDAYSNLMDAYEEGNAIEIDRCGRQLETAIKLAAKDIHNKYIEPPFTTDFAIMFLPFEGLYSEVVRRGLIEKLQSEYKINIAGPTTMAALLNSLQMGFKTLAIQKHSGEVWKTLAAVKTEFGKFESVLTKAQSRLNQANSELETLVGTRTRMMHSKLKNIHKIGDDKEESSFKLNEIFEEEE